MDWIYGRFLALVFVLFEMLVAMEESLQLRLYEGQLYRSQ
jgi:hypothetical protein